LRAGSSCLSLDLLENETLARTYVALECEKLRAMWVKKQLEKNGGDMEVLFVDWSNDSQNR
jgi:hypothetical protein